MFNKKFFAKLFVVALLACVLAGCNQPTQQPSSLDQPTSCTQANLTLSALTPYDVGSSSVENVQYETTSGFLATNADSFVSGLPQHPAWTYVQNSAPNDPNATPGNCENVIFYFHHPKESAYKIVSWKHDGQKVTVVYTSKDAN